MRRALILLLAMSPVLPSWVAWHPLEAQAAPRTDTPRRGALRLTFDPTILYWQDQFLDGRRRPLGAPLTGDSLNAPPLPLLGRLQQDVRTAGADSAFRASLGQTFLGVHAERRVTALTAEFGLTDRLSLGVMVPLVRINVRANLSLDSGGSTLGANPRAGDPSLDSAYANFFAEFDAALAQLDTTQANQRAFYDSAQAVRDALYRSAWGPDGVFLPTDSSAGGRAIDANIIRIQQEFGTYGVTGFTRTFLLPGGRLSAAGFAALLEDSLVGVGAGPLTDTRRSTRFWAGDAEVAARYRVAAGPRYAATIGVLLRLPTGHQDSPHNLLDLSTGDHQTDLEAQLVQELVVGRRLWLNLALRGGRQRPGTRERRVAPPGEFLVPRNAWARLAWDPGDYIGIDFAPLYRLTPYFAAGVTLGYWHKGSDAYRFATPQDSLDLAARFGAPLSAGILDAQTAERRVRLGGAMTYVGPRFEAGVSVERTVSGEGAPIPAATVFRIVMRTSQRLF